LINLIGSLTNFAIIKKIGWQMDGKSSINIKKALQ